MGVEALGDLVPRVDPTAWLHPTATVIGDVEIGPGCSLWPGAVVRGDFGSVRIGAQTNVQDNAVIHADPGGTVIGDRCTIAHRAFVEGAVIEDGILVGIAAIVLPGSRLRTGSAVAAGAVVTGIEVPPGTRAQGIPARILPDGRLAGAYAEHGAREYVAMAARYAREHRPA